MKSLALSFLLCMAVFVRAQSPQMTIVQAANQPPVKPAGSAAQGAAVTVPPNESASILKTLLEIKAANDETLKKQQATLERLDELQKAAEQIKIFAHRG